MTSEQIRTKTLAIISEYFGYINASAEQGNRHNYDFYSGCLRDILELSHLTGTITAEERYFFLSEIDSALDTLIRGGEQCE